MRSAPLDVYALRGGMYRETAWTRSPLQPTVIASTVDQVGSRLLFRGYGISDSMKPIHAGLVGNDALILLDEAHCAKPFDQTMQAVKSYRGWKATNEALPPFTFVSLTATPTEDIQKAEQQRKRERPDTLTLIEEDQDEDRQHPMLGARIAASKPAKLVIAKKAKDKNDAAELVEALKKHALEMLEQNLGKDEKGKEHSVQCVGIIVNRVKTARELKAMLGEEAVLLTGRMRPLDRDNLFEEWLKPLLSNSEETQALPKFVIGTQCLECGADFDFHALVTECASLDALRQRFGRLNRVANRPTAKAVIVIRGDQIEDTSEDPIYGASLARTWNWLKRANEDVFDFGVSAVRAAVEGIDLTPLNAPTEDAPVLFPAHLDCLVQTNPTPTPDPDPALFLHGPKQTGQPDVQVVFRSDLGDDPKLWAEIVALCPPSSSEAAPVPIGVFKKWLAAERVEDLSSDLEGETSAPEPVKVGAGARFALCWQGPVKSRPISDPKNVRPNQAYVIPCSATDVSSLCDFIGETPSDYAEQAFQRSRDKALLRLPDLNIPEGTGRVEAATVVNEAIQAAEDNLSDKSPGWLKLALASLKALKHREVDPHPLGGFVVTGKGRLHQFDPTYLDDSEPDESFRGREVPLAEHSRNVAEHAKTFAAGCGLDAELYYQVGLWHDLGKLDPRFQAMLKQSSPRTAVGEPLAKSARSPRTKQERDEAREVHCYPKGARHELLSTALVAALIATKTDDDLGLHLLATHHGSGRPLAAPVEDDYTAKQPFKAQLFGQTYELPTYGQQTATWNLELPERFWRVVRRFGWWGSSYLEAVFRLADHAASRAEQEEEYDSTKIPNVRPTAVLLRSAPERLHSLALNGLDGSNPLGFLVALGVLRLADQAFKGKAKLSWNQSGHWQPVLHLTEAATENHLVDELHSRVHRTANPIASDEASVLYDEYRVKSKRAEAAMKAIKERKLRGAERAAAIESTVVPLTEIAATARRAWLLALEGAVPAPFLSLGKALSVTSEEFRCFAVRVAERLHSNGPAERSDADFASAFGSEVCYFDSGRIVPTEFQLITGSGHQFFLETLKTLMETVTSDQIRQAIFGPWTYSDPRLSFRWDPLDDRRYAYGWGDPSSVEVRTEHGANLLAAFALPLFPLIPTIHGPCTTGFNGLIDPPAFTWPIWAAPLSIDAVRSLLAADGLQQNPVNRIEMRMLGVSDMFQVRKIEIGRPPLSKLNLTSAIAV
jgi:CRISPR-associated endonuclease/helicase Cas3